MPSYKLNNASVYATGDRAVRGVSRRKAIAAASLVAGGLGLSAFASTGSALDVLGSIDGLKQRALAMVDEAKLLVDALSSFDFILAQQKAHAVADLAADLQDEFSGGLWTAATFVPVYGGDVKAIRTLVNIVADLTSEGLVPFCDALAGISFDDFVVAAGESVSIDLPTLQTLLDVVSAAMPTLHASVEEFNKIGDLHIEQLDSAVSQVRSLLGPYLDKLDFIDVLLAAAPRMLGSQGKRTYMVVAQNNCEIRPTGGFPGSIGFVTAENGTVSLGDFASMYDYMPREPGIRLELTEEELNLFGDGISYYAGTMNTVPHFPRVCDLWSQLLEHTEGIVLDGVVAVDPVFLQNLVALFGSITMSDGTVLDGTNTAEAIMNDVYWRYNTNNAAQDAFFTEAASRAVELIVDGLPGVDFMSLLGVVKKAMDTRRLTAWFRNEEEQSVLHLAGCTGEVGQDRAEPQTGIYLSDETWGKMGWWIDRDLQTEWQPAPVSGGLFGHAAEEKPEGVGGTTTVSYTLANTMPLDYLDYSNPYVFGSGPLRRQDGDIVLRVWLYAPAGGRIENFSAGIGSMSYEAPAFAETTHMGLQVLVGYVQLLPGEWLTLTYDVVVDDSAEHKLVFDMTPICHD